MWIAFLWITAYLSVVGAIYGLIQGRKDMPRWLRMLGGAIFFALWFIAIPATWLCDRR